MKTIIRNFTTTLSKFKLASALNILGLSVAFASFIAIIAQVRYEFTFDTSYPDYEQIYRVEMSTDSISYHPLMSRPMVDIINQASPQIKHSSIYGSLNQEQYATINKDGIEVGFDESVIPVDSGYADLFGMRMVEGSSDVLKEPGKVIIPLSMSKRFLGDKSAVGEIIKMKDTNENWEIGGVYHDFAVNTSQFNQIIRKIPDTDNKDDWGNQNYYNYVCIEKGANPEDIAEVMNQEISKATVPSWLGTGYTFKLNPISEIYFQPALTHDISPRGNRSTTMTLLSIAILIIVIASINFVNFSTSLTPIRIKSINTQKVLGSPISTLRLALIFEAVGICVMAYAISIFWVVLMSKSSIANIFTSPIDLLYNIDLVVITFCIALTVGFASGLYPALYSTSFAPALVLNGTFALSAEGRKLRTGLIGFQFVISIALIIAASFFQIQNRYIRDYSTGVDTEHIAVVKLSEDMASTHRVALVNSLKENAIIEDVAFSGMVLGSRDFYMTWGRNLNDGKYIQFTCFPVSHNFLDVMGLTVTEGRNFNESDDIKNTGTFIFNETARKQFEISLDTGIPGHMDTVANIAGFVKDFNFSSLRQNVGPIALYNFGAKDAWDKLTISYIKINGNPYQAVDHIKSSIAKIDPTYPVTIDFYDEMFNQTYKQEVKTSSLITFFSVLAVLISLVGVFGLVVFETQFRRKEIGVRRVFGAGIDEILLMFNKSFVIIVLVCFVIGAPCAWYGVTSWLTNFAYRTPLHWWVFVLALLAVLIITIATVTIQSWRAATENPVDSIRK